MIRANPNPSLLKRGKTLFSAEGCFALLLLLLLHTGLLRVFATTKEYQLKAVVLWRLAQFVDWPSNAFSGDASPLIIGVLGEDPFGDALVLAVNGETAHGRTLQIQRYSRPEEIGECHVLFISKSEAGRGEEITRALQGRSVLTVSDMEGFAREKDGMIRFLMENNKITLRINLDAVRPARLVLDARLLRMADVIGRK